jgi:hypothetical protein
MNQLSTVGADLAKTIIVESIQYQHRSSLMVLVSRNTLRHDRVTDRPIAYCELIVSDVIEHFHLNSR